MLIDLFFIVLAVFLVIKLKTILGEEYDDLEKDESFRKQKVKNIDAEIVTPKPTHHNVQIPQDTSPEEKNIIAPDAIAALHQLQQINPIFTATNILQASEEVFLAINKAYTTKNIDAINAFIQPELAKKFLHTIDKLNTAKHTPYSLIVRMINKKINSIKINESSNDIEVIFNSERINYTLDEKGNLVLGNKDSIIEVTEIMTFSQNKQTFEWKLSKIETQ